MRPPQFEWSNSFQDIVIETKFLACCREFFVKRLLEKPCSLVMNFYEKVVRICWKYLILLRRGSPGLLCLEKAPGGGSSEQNATILFDCLFILFEKSESKSSSPKFLPITSKEQTYHIFVIFFTRAKFLENKIYTEERQLFALNL